jgi:tryptophan synthase alpha chain
LSGVERIDGAFSRARANGARAALMPYLMGGYPDLDRSREIALAYVRGGADLLELGVPFSDPLADGPVIHAAATAALGAGVHLRQIVSLAGELAAHVPVVLMTYANPVLAYGVEAFADALAEGGCGGVIVPDLPLEEADAMREALDSRQLALVPLVAPTTPEERLARIGARASGFLYVVALTGTTGERPDGQPSREEPLASERASAGPPGSAAAPGSHADALASLISRAKAHTTVPVAIGFGIGTPAQAARAASYGADGVIVGSRLVRCVAEEADPVPAVERQVREFATALRGEPTG